MRTIDPVTARLLEEVRKAYEAIPERFRDKASKVVLVRAVAKLVTGLSSEDGLMGNGVSHSWIKINNDPNYIIDVRPYYFFPGPLIVDVLPCRKQGMYITDSKLTARMNELSRDEVAEITDATEAARRFLGMP